MQIAAPKTQMISSSMNRDCDTCTWHENGRCTHVNKNAKYPCLDWSRRFDPEKDADDKKWADMVEAWEKIERQN